MGIGMQEGLETERGRMKLLGEGSCTSKGHCQMQNGFPEQDLESHQAKPTV